MTAQTAEPRPVADRATRFIKVHLAGTVGRDESFYVTGRFEVIVLGVALLATERVVDLVVADDAVRHFRHVERRNLGAVRHSAMAGIAGVVRVEVLSDIARRLEIGFLVDRLGDHRCDVAHLEMLLVAEMSHPGGWRIRNLPRLVARPAGFLFGQQIVRRSGAGGSRRVARAAARFQFQVELMRKGRGIRCRAPDRDHLSGDLNGAKPPHH